MPLALGLFSLLVLACAIILVARRRAAHGETAFFLIAALLACFLTLDLGLPILALLPSIEIIQFPWRFLAVAAFAIAVLAGLVTRDLLRYHRYAGALLLCLILITSYPMAAIPGGSMGEPGIRSIRASLAGPSTSRSATVRPSPGCPTPAATSSMRGMQPCSSSARPP